jgi:L-arabinose isomerase
MNKNSFVDEIVVQKNIIVENLTEDEKKEVDIYLDEILKEMSDSIKFLEKLRLNDEKRKNIAGAFKSEIEEQKWLEKLSKTFYDRADIQDPTKTQKE